MVNAIRNFQRRFQLAAIDDERGLSTVEYTIILLLIAVFAIGAWTAFGSELNAKINTSVNELQGIEPGDVQGSAP